MQDLGAALGAIDDLPDWAAQLAAAIDETQAPAEAAALEECHD
jgi:hypothetical protein